MRGDKAPEKDRSERYLLTYADLMNLLLILFIVLFATSIQDVAKASAVVSAIQEGFKGSTSQKTSSANGLGTSKPGTGLASSSATSDYSDFYSELIGMLKARGLLDKVGISADSNEVVISLKDNVLFAPGKADLNTDAATLLTNIGSLLTKISYGQVLIEGHTDSDPIHTAQFQDNRELSLMRAYNVAEIFQKAGVDPKKTLPVGYGEWWPVAPNDTASNKSKNRRVVITILRKAVTPPDQSYHAEDLIHAFEGAATGRATSSGGSTSKSTASK